MDNTTEPPPRRSPLDKHEWAVIVLVITQMFAVAMLGGILLCLVHIVLNQHALAEQLAYIQTTANAILRAELR